VMCKIKSTEVVRSKAEEELAELEGGSKVQ
jgi:hypothetical protein